MTARGVDPYVANLLDKISEGKRVLNPKKAQKIFFHRRLPMAALPFE